MSWLCLLDDILVGIGRLLLGPPEVLPDHLRCLNSFQLINNFIWFPKLDITFQSCKVKHDLTWVNPSCCSQPPSTFLERSEGERKEERNMKSNCLKKK